MGSRRIYADRKAHRRRQELKDEEGFVLPGRGRRPPKQSNSRSRAPLEKVPCDGRKRLPKQGGGSITPGPRSYGVVLGHGIRKPGPLWPSVACPLPHYIDGGPQPRSHRRSSSGRGTSHCFSEGSLVLPFPRAGQGLREQPQGGRKAIRLAGQEVLADCLVTHVAALPGSRPEMLSCIHGRSSWPA